MSQVIAEGVIKIGGRTNELGKDLARARGMVKGSASGMMMDLRGLLASVGVGAFFGAAIKLAAEYEQTVVSFTTVLGRGADFARGTLRELQQFAIDTPFTVRGVEDAARGLIGVGFTAEELIPTLKRLGDISAGIGRGEDGMQRLVLNLGQVRTQGKLTGRELRDFAILGVPLMTELADSMGVAKEEILEMTSAGKIGFQDVVDAFDRMTQKGGLFANLMDALLNTLSGQFSQFKDSLTLVFREIGALIIQVFDLNSAVQNLSVLVEKVVLPFVRGFVAVGAAVFDVVRVMFRLVQVTASFFGIVDLDQLNNFIEDLGILAGIVTTLGIAFVAVKTAVWMYNMAMAVAQALSGPIGWKVLAVSLGLAAGAVVTLTGVMNDFSTKLAESNAKADEAKEKANKLAKEELGLMENVGGATAAIQSQAQALSNLTAWVDNWIARWDAGKTTMADFLELTTDLQGRLDSFLGADRRTEGEKLVDTFTALGSAASSMQDEIDKFGDSPFGTGQKLVDDLKLSLDLIKKQAAEQSGYNDALKSTQKELAIMRGHYSAIDFQLKEIQEKAGGLLTGQQMADLRATLEELQKEKDDRKKDAALQSEADQIKKAIETPAEAFRREIARIKELRDAGKLTEIEARKAIDKSGRDNLGFGQGGAMQSGRFGVSQFGDAIQDNLLKNEEKQRDLERNAHLFKILQNNEAQLKEARKKKGGLI